MKPQFNLQQRGIGHITPAQTLQHINEMINQPGPARTRTLFKKQTANKWIDEAKQRPIPKMLFDEFWFESELCILFAENGVGKSLLAVQIANSISLGKPVPGFKLEAESQPVLYFDFELTDKQFEGRYSVNYQNHYHFNSNLIRAEIDPDNTDYEEQGFTSFEDYLSHELEQDIIETGIRIIIIDNITYLKTETEKAKDALPLMKRLIDLKKKYKLSLLILAHTPKRDLSQPITRNHLQGSKHLSNLTDSIFTIGESVVDSKTRYLKQIKSRSSEVQYDSGNVIECRVHQPDNFVLFEFTGYGTEGYHLKAKSTQDKTELENNVEQLLATEPGITGYAIAKKLCTDESKFKSFQTKVNRIIKRLEDGNN
ncbi:AAA domain-containing protein [Mucilaginibacter frigoritolerans]|uniref:AAA domain-containing protein n=1 Tax=Mucilaginibacter frigoritolerans TaxID=652788 RepID=A0A562U3V1_9SPHI|nr:AAA family ATPase [Mucilaginibacter frigoritolerans]TWJ00017.1 AAA domain-containing protein [Mucilaginibacter frigoritolerans]